MKYWWLLSLIVLSACAPGGPQKSLSGAKSTASNSSGGAGGDVQGDPESIAAISTSVGVRNFEQVNATMAALTGIVGNSQINTKYNNLKGQLPADNDIKSFSFSGQSAVTELAAEYCTVLITNANNTYTTQRTAAVGTINFAALPTVALGATGRADVALSLLTKFWGSGFVNQPNAAQSQTTISTLINDLVVGEPNTTATTRNAVIGACTSVLASAPVTTI
jgi:hypothetical protein